MNLSDSGTATDSSAGSGSGGDSQGSDSAAHTSALSDSQGSASDTTSASASGVSATATESSTTTGSSTTNEGGCAKDQVVCDGQTAKVCDGEGGYSKSEICSKACAEGLGCVECLPNARSCDDNIAKLCKDDGSGYEETKLCDSLQGMSCDGESGSCLGACATLGTRSYIGCDYYPVISAQLDNFLDKGPFAVAVANTTTEVAAVTVTRGDQTIAQLSVTAGSVEIIELPWVDELVEGQGPSILVQDGSYRLRSTQPVTLYQYNLLTAGITNDASLMLPVNTWTGNYAVASWQFWELGDAGFYSVTASQDQTTVTVNPPGGGTPTQAGAGVNAMGYGQVVLDEGDVLQVFVADGGDATGTLVSADKPVQVLGGHECTEVPAGTKACDHLEDVMFPVETLAKEYFVVPPVQVEDATVEKAIIVRIIATEPDTHLVFEPEQPAAKHLANAGDFVELPPSTAKFLVQADKKILVSQFMLGQEAGYGNGDPAMLLAVPSAQYRNNYLFYADIGWEANYVDIVAPNEAGVQVDGTKAQGFLPIGTSGFSVAHVKLSNEGDGTHSVTSNYKVGISVYGLQKFGSYWYPGGLDLEVIPK